MMKKNREMMKKPKIGWGGSRAKSGPKKAYPSVCCPLAWAWEFPGRGSSQYILGIWAGNPPSTPPPFVGARNRYHLSFWRFVLSFIAFLGPIWGQSMQLGQLWCCHVFLVFKTFQVVLGSWNPEFTIYPFRARVWPFQAPKTLRCKGKMDNFEAKNTIKQEKKKTPKGQMVPISRVYTPPP